MSYGKSAPRIVVLTALGGGYSVDHQVATCCDPNFGDEIAGFRQSGMVIIHRTNCTHIPSTGELRVAWDASEYLIIVEAIDRPYMAANVSEIVTYHVADLLEFDAYVRYDGKIEIRMRSTLSRKNRQSLLQEPDLEKIKQDVMQIPFVENVRLIRSELSMWLHQRLFGIQREERFYGRPRERQELELFLETESTIIILGPKQVGKWSLMMNLASHLEPNLIPIFIDVQQMMKQTGIMWSTSEFILQLMHRITQKLKIQSHLYIPLPRQVRLDPVNEFEIFLNRLQQTIESRFLCFMFREFQALTVLQPEGCFTWERLLEALLSFTITNDVRLILSSSKPERELAEMLDFHRVFEIGFIYPLGFLEPDEARRYLVDSMITKGIYLEKEAVDWLLDITACHPRFLCKLTEEIYKNVECWEREKIVGNSSSITYKDVKEIVNKWIDGVGDCTFQHLWSTDANKSVLSAVSQLCGYRIFVAEVHLVNMLKIPQQSLKKALEDLVALGTLEINHSRSYRIRVKLLAYWLIASGTV